MIVALRSVIKLSWMERKGDYRFARGVKDDTICFTFNHFTACPPITMTYSYRLIELSLGLFFLLVGFNSFNSTWAQVVNDKQSASNSGLTADAVEQAPRWWKGNLHTHSLWSDGDDFPEMIAAWYVEHDYNFLALSDHNILSQGMRWMPLADIVKRSDDQVLQRYQRKFGSAWVETRPAPQDQATQDQAAPGLEVRLKPLDEFRALVEQAGKFIMIQGEEISDKVDGKPLHINATNLHELIKPLGGPTIREAMQNNLRNVLEQETRLGREILPHLNHPNFHYAVTAEDLGHVIQERFFEVYNGHPDVHQLGDAEHMSIERMWDVANAIRLTQLDAPPLWGIATDDSHEYHGRPGARPGRGWVMVRARYLTPEHLIRAMKQADFYASSGVVLDSIDYNPKSRTLSIAIPAADNQQFTTEFIATLKPSRPDNAQVSVLPAPHEIGTVVATSHSLTPSYTFTGNEVYVRARITSSAPHVDPSLENQRQQAWTQPVVLGE